MATVATGIPEVVPATSAKQAISDKYHSIAARSFPEVAGVDAVTLHGWMSDPTLLLVIVDVRACDEQAVSTLPGNVVTKETFEASKDKYRDYRIVTYCTIGGRSGKYASVLKAEGFDVFNLEGSILSWSQEGYPVVCGGEQTKRVHVCGKIWAPMLASGYEAVLPDQFTASSVLNSICKAVGL